MACATITIEASPEVLNRLIIDIQELALMNNSTWNDESGKLGRRISSGYREIAGQLIDQGFHG